MWKTPLNSNLEEILSSFYCQELLLRKLVRSGFCRVKIFCIEEDFPAAAQTFSHVTGKILGKTQRNNKVKLGEMKICFSIFFVINFS